MDAGVADVPSIRPGLLLCGGDDRGISGVILRPGRDGLCPSFAGEKPLGMTAVCARCGAVYWVALGHCCRRRGGGRFAACQGELDGRAVR